jgi:hypothetical protein
MGGSGLMCERIYFNERTATTKEIQRRFHELYHVSGSTCWHSNHRGFIETFYLTASLGVFVDRHSSISSSVFKFALFFAGRRGSSKNK